MYMYMYIHIYIYIYNCCIIVQHFIVCYKHDRIV